MPLRPLPAGVVDGAAVVERALAVVPVVAVVVAAASVLLRRRSRPRRLHHGRPVHRPDRQGSQGDPCR